MESPDPTLKPKFDSRNPSGEAVLQPCWGTNPVCESKIKTKILHCNVCNFSAQIPLGICPVHKALNEKYFQDTPPESSGS
jgi:hypothetical protein